MLVLSRKDGEGLVIGDNIKVTVVKIKGNRIRLGIEAPPEVPVRRAEIPRPFACDADFASVGRTFDCVLPK